MPSPASAGVIWSLRWDFGDGNPNRKKYVVVLNDCSAPNDLVIAAFTTSQGVKRYALSETGGRACGDLWYRVDAGKLTVFDEASWIQFDNLLLREGRPLTLAELHAEESKGKAQVITAIPDELLMSVLYCAGRSEDVVEAWLKLVKKAYDRLEQERKVRQEAAKAANAKKTPPEWSLQSLKQHCIDKGYPIKTLYELTGLREIEIAPRLAGSKRAETLESINIALGLLEDDVTNAS